MSSKTATVLESYGCKEVLTESQYFGRPDSVSPLLDASANASISVSVSMSIFVCMSVNAPRSVSRSVSMRATGSAFGGSASRVLSLRASKII